MLIQNEKEKCTSLSKDISFRLSILKFMSIIAVVYLHSYAQVVHMKGEDIDLSVYEATFMIESIVNSITRFAVPLFFCISGFLFFSKGYENGYLDFVRKKTKSILFPYLLWNAICIAYMLILQSMPFCKKYFSKALILSWGIMDWIHAFIGFSNGWTPILYPLWFLLILYFVFLLVYPLKDFLIKRPYLVILLMLINIICLNFNVFHFLFFPRLINALSFFCMGCLISMYLKYTDKTFVCLLSGFIFFTTRVLYGLSPESDIYILISSDVGLYVGVIFFFSLSHYFIAFSESTKEKLLKVSSFSFLIYMMHENLLTILKKICYSLIPLKSFVPLTVFFVLPFCLVMSLIIFGSLLKRVCPNIYRFLFSR